MSRRKQSGLVAVAEFPYRHQAEFAAGFLRDALIPVRVETGDGQAAGIGMIGRGARVWVRSDDEAKARDVLEGYPASDEPGRDDAASEAKSPESDDDRPPPEAGDH